MGGTVKYHYYGDWLQPGKVPSDPIVSEMSAGFSSMMAVQIASRLGDAVARSRFAGELERMQHAYDMTYWNAKLSSFGDGSQAPQVFALFIGGLEDAHEELARKH